MALGTCQAPRPGLLVHIVPETRHTYTYATDKYRDVPENHEMRPGETGARRTDRAKMLPIDLYRRARQSMYIWSSLFHLDAGGM